METMRESWTDRRLDGFAAHVDQRFDAVDQRFEAVDQRFDAVDKRFDTMERRMDNGFNRIDADLRAQNARFDALQRTMLQIGASMIAGMFAMFAALLGLIVTQL